MSNPGPGPEPTVTIILDASAIAEYGRSEHVGEVITDLPAIMALDQGVDEGNVAGSPAFGVPVLSLATAWADARDKDAQDLISSLVAHPWCVLLPVEESQVRRHRDAGWEFPLSMWSSLLGSHESAAAVVAAVDHRCHILTATPEEYLTDTGGLEALLVLIPADGDTWPDMRDYWPTDE